MQARPGRQRRGTRAPSGTTRGLAPRRPREVARALAERCACGRPRRKEGGAWAEVWRQGSWGWAGRGLLGRAGGGARLGSGRAGPRRGAGSGGRSVTHAAVREAAAAVAAGAAGTATGARARAGAGCLLPSLARRLRGRDRPRALRKEEGGPRTPTSSLSSRGSQPRRRLRLRRGSSALRGGAYGQSVRGGGRPGLSLSAEQWAGIS